MQKLNKTLRASATPPRISAQQPFSSFEGQKAQPPKSAIGTPNSQQRSAPKAHLAKLGILVAVLCLIVVSSNAQEVDRDYIEFFSDKIYFSPRYGFKNPSIRLRPKGRTLDWQAKYRPNAPNNIGFQLAYKSFAFGFGLPLPIATSKKEKYGKTKNLDINIQVAKPSFLVELSIKNYKGLADHNSPNYPDDTSYDLRYYKRADAKFFYLKGNFIYIFNKERYSYRAGFNFMERQLKSAGSPMLIGNFSYLRLKGDSSLIAPPITAAYPESATMERLRVLDTGAGAGYAYSFVYDRFIVGAGLFLGLDFQHNAYYTPDKKRQVNAVPLIDFRLTAGYNGDTFFAGISSNTDLNLINFAEVKGRFFYQVLTFRLGFRFDAPRGLERLEEKSPFSKD